ncbi:SPW repeat protein [Chlamydiifrater phoenicopteri]|uniref:SPW repeat protein n=1 Tax=Chlamydiifrater phoenicopteri TaxID=2681469 RepID=UPI001BCC7CA0|nr:SPW repeat protein [Chlamydiifrater phoenicopteri]
MDKETFSNIHRHFRYSLFKINCLFVFLGLWCLASPYTLGYESKTVITSDLCCGCALIFLAALMTFWRPLIYLGALIGIWICCVATFLTNSPVVFANDTLIGFAILLASVSSPSRPKELDVGPSIPEGLQYNPSTYGRRLIILFLVVLSWIQSRHLTASCLGFASGALSLAGLGKCSQELFYIQGLLSISFAVFGAFILSGREKRWHTRPLSVLASGFILLIIAVLTLLPVALGGKTSWACPLCTVMILKQALLIAFSFDEIKATCIYLAKIPSNKQGGMFRVLFRGSEFYNKTLIWEERSLVSASKLLRESFKGLSLPLNLIAVILIAFALAETSQILGISDQMENFLKICSRFVITFSILAFSESLRALRLMNLAFGFGVAITPLLFRLPYGQAGFSIILLSGLTIMALSLRKGRFDSETRS